MNYYYHTSLSALSQSDLYSILWIGGIAGGILFVLLILAVSIKKISGLDQHRGDNIIGAVTKVLIQIFTISIFWLFFIVIVYTFFMYGTSSSSDMNIASSLEWFLHTDWIGKTEELSNSIDSIVPYGDEAVEIAKNTIAMIYLVKLLWILSLFSFFMIVSISVTMKINKMANENRVNTFQYSATLAMSGMLSMTVIVGVIALMNSAIGETFMMSDKIDKTNIGNKSPSIQRIYLDALNPNKITALINQI